MNEPVIKIENITKKYKLGVISAKTLNEELQILKAKIQGKENPTAKIGTISKKGTFEALSDISLNIYKGETIGIIGRNGAGKSTLLKILSNIVTPTSGKATIKGRISSMLEIGTGFHPELTGIENIYLNGAILGMTKAEITEKLDEIIDFSECREFINTPVKRYSSGMYVKLAFSVAAHLSSEILIMDEVLAVGDAKFQQKCIDKMLLLAKQENRTILYVSHNMSTVEKLCTRAIVLDKGKLIYDGNTQNAISAYLSSRENITSRIDFSNTNNPSKNSSPIDIKCASYTKESIDFSNSEPLEITFLWENNDNIKDLCMRLTVYDFQKQPIATSVLKNFYSGRKNEKVKQTLSFDISSIAPGEYETRYTFFYLSGTIRNLFSAPGLSFNKITSLSESDIKWFNKVWGNIILPPPKMK